MSSVILIIVGAVIGYFIYDYFIRDKNNTKNSSVNSEINNTSAEPELTKEKSSIDSSEKNSIENEDEKEIIRIKSSMKSLLKINMYLRTTIIDKDVVIPIEELIDDIRNIIEPINNKKYYSSLSMTVNSIGSQYLPKILKPYAELKASGISDKDLLQYTNKLITNINDMKKEVENIRNNLENNTIESFGKFNAQLNALFDTYVVSDTL